MKKEITAPLCFLLAIMGTSCLKDQDFPISKDYPLIETQIPKDLNNSGITLSAKILATGTSEIIDYGFIWYGVKESRISLSGEIAGNYFEHRVSGDLPVGEVFSYRAFVQTDANLVLGEIIEFTSQGGLPPKILSLFPAEGPEGTPVEIVADHLSPQADRNRIFIAGEEATIVKVEGNKMQFIFPDMETSAPIPISLQVGTGEAVLSSQTFTLLGPEITSISLSEAYPGEQLTINGRYLQHSAGVALVKIDGNRADTLEVSDTRITVIIPPLSAEKGLELSEANVEVVRGYRSAFSPTSLRVKPFWTEEPTPPFTGDWRFPAVVYKDKAYVLALSDRFLYEFDPASKVWRAVSRYPGDIDDSNVLAVFDDKLFKFSGSSSTYEEGDLWVYDFGSETWETKEKMPFRFYKGSQFRIGEQIFMVTDLGQVWSYAPGSGIFSRKNDFPDEVERVNFAFKENGDQFLVNWSNIWRYNSEQDEWNATLSPYATGFSGTTGEYYPGFIQNGALHQLRDFQDIYRFDRTHNRSFRIARYPHCYKDENRIRTAFTINDKTYIFYAYDDYRESCMLAMYAFKYGD